jgi:uracil phosphoribosyltransferase
MNEFSNLIVINHPLLQDKLARMRDRNTKTDEFRRLLVQIAALMTYEACRHFETTQRSVETPLEGAQVEILKREITVVPILRAGLAMIDGIISIIPEARVGMMGLYRDEATLKPVDYYKKLPAHLEEIPAADTLKNCGAKRLFMMSLIASPDGAEVMMEKHPDVKVYAAGLDRELNEKGFILPGLGDVGDRCFGT